MSVELHLEVYLERYLEVIGRKKVDLAGGTIGVETAIVLRGRCDKNRQSKY